MMQENQSLVGKQIEIKGWVRTLRAQKTFAFLEVNDGSSVGGLQVILSTDAEGYSLVEDGLITTGCSVVATGELVESPGGKQALELNAASLHLIGAPDNPKLRQTTQTISFSALLHLLCNERPWISLLITGVCYRKV
jgi:aspartyl/asparaginyl-tRNA synthetase